MVDVSGLLLSVSSLSFSVSLSLSWESSSTPFSEATSPSSSSSPLLLYPMNSPQNYSSSRKYFLYLDSCFLFLLNFCSWLNYYRFLTLQGPSRNVFSAQGLVTYYEGVTHTQLGRRCLWLKLYVHFDVIVRRESRKEYSLEAAILCSNSESRFSDTAWERWLKTSFIHGSSSSLLELSLFSCSLSCSSSTKSIFLFILMCSRGRRSFEW